VLEVFVMRALSLLLAIGFLATGFLPTGWGQSVNEPATNSSAAALPKDVDPQSFSRLPVVKRDDLDNDGKRIYDELAGGEGKTVTPTGPAAISLYSPKVAEAIQMLNQYLRFQGVLKPRDYEVAILVTAREFDQQYEWSGHEMAARSAKVPQPVIDTIKYKKDAVGLSDRDTLLITFARDSFHKHKIDSDLYSKAVATFGKQGTLELATIIGDYAMAAIMLNATDQHLPPGRPELLPPPGRPELPAK
jgi:4-carboxymuconolactone decarboxylase